MIFLQLYDSRGQPAFYTLGAWPFPNYAYVLEARISHGTREKKHVPEWRIELDQTLNLVKSSLNVRCNLVFVTLSGQKMTIFWTLDT